MNRRPAVSCAFLVASFAAPGLARADDTGGTYGRIEGDLTVAASVGATVTPDGTRGALDARVRYLDTAGLFATYEDGFGTSTDPTRVFVSGLELRPMFLGRWLLNMESGRPYADLILDSIGLDLGLLMVQPKGGSMSGLPGLQVGLSAEVPIFPRASGPWVRVHGGMRFDESTVVYGTNAATWGHAPFLTITLGWHQVLATHIVDIGDTPPP
jgi:hypothetical protein